MIKTEKWHNGNNYNLPKAIGQFGCIIFKQYMIIFGGGIDNHNVFNDIYICNSTDFKWKKLDLKCPPKPGKMYAVLENVDIHLFLYARYSGHYTININNIIPEQL